MTLIAPTLGESLDHPPQALQFGTSGRRGLLLHLTQLELYINALAELEYLQTLPLCEGGIVRGDPFYFASDLRPTSTRFNEHGQGELAQSILLAIESAGMVPVYLGCIPTPALMAHAIGQGKGSMMVTGSHIPFDRNGYKTNTSRGELLKHHETPINAQVEQVRARVYAEPLADSPFDVSGCLKSGHRDLPEANPGAARAYVQRYVDFFGADALTGLRLVFYQHSAVGRDLVPAILRALGAEVFETGRSEVFVPIDTENIDAEQLGAIQGLLDSVMAGHGRMDALVSTDGDSDRPLLLGVNAETGEARFFGGDLLGMMAAGFLEAGSVVVPISCNDAIDRGRLKSVLEPKTRIGSPFVIAGMEAALAKGRAAVCGWEANGGFLTGSDFYRDERKLSALPTRDAVLPIVAVLASARAEGVSLIELFGRLPPRYGKAALLRDFPRCRALSIVKRFSPESGTLEEQASIHKALARYFSPEQGFAVVGRVDYTDGVRIYFENGDVAHIRPSGNADELRIYAVADSQARADFMVDMAVAEGGILRAMEREICDGVSG